MIGFRIIDSFENHHRSRFLLASLATSSPQGKGRCRVAAEGLDKNATLHNVIKIARIEQSCEIVLHMEQFPCHYRDIPL
jgi:hypothetical protein